VATTATSGPGWASGHAAELSLYQVLNKTQVTRGSGVDLVIAVEEEPFTGSSSSR
jgi:hypothetical protein